MWHPQDDCIISTDANSIEEPEMWLFHNNIDLGADSRTDLLELDLIDAIRMLINIAWLNIHISNRSVDHDFIQAYSCMALQGLTYTHTKINTGVSGYWMLWQPRLSLAEDSRTNDFQLGLFVVISIRMDSSWKLWSNLKKMVDLDFVCI